MITVNQQTISENQILHEMQYHPSDTHRAAMVEAAQSLIIGELLQQRATELGVNCELTSDETTQEQATDALLEQLIAIDVAIPKASEQECEQYYQNNLDKFCTSALLSARHILLAVPPGQEEQRAQASEQAQSIIASLKEGADFSTLAAQYSRCDSSKVGGQLGQLSKGQTVPEFERQVFKADVGLITQPIETRYGYHIVYVDFKEEGKQLPFDMVHERIKDYLNTKVERKAIAQYIQHLITEAEIKGFNFDVDASPLMQ